MKDILMFSRSQQVSIIQRVYKEEVPINKIKLTMSKKNYVDRVTTSTKKNIKRGLNFIWTLYAYIIF